MKRLLSIMAVALVSFNLTNGANTPSRTASQLVGVMAGLRAEQKPGFVAAVVRSSPPSERGPVIRALLAAVANGDRGSLPQVVGAIGVVVPELTPMAALEAARWAPELGAAILASATQAAPAFAQQTGRVLLGAKAPEILWPRTAFPAGAVSSRSPRAINVGPPPVANGGGSRTIPGTIRGAHPTTPPEPVNEPTPIAGGRSIP